VTLVHHGVPIELITYFEYFGSVLMLTLKMEIVRISETSALQPTSKRLYHRGTGSTLESSSFISYRCVML